MRDQLALIRLLVLALGVFTVIPASAPRGEELITAISDDTLRIDTAFDGATLTFAGEIRPGTGADGASFLGPYHVVMVIKGPEESRTVHGASNPFGIWLNTSQATFSDVPGYRWVLASGRLDAIVSEMSPSRSQMAPLPELRASAGESDFDAELGRLMTEQGYYGFNEQGVQFLSSRFYTARLAMGHNLPTGLYLARTYVLRDGIVVARKSQSFSVRVVGFERLVGEWAQTQPLLYGIGCVLLALLVGWLGGVAFKR